MSDPMVLGGTIMFFGLLIAAGIWKFITLRKTDPEARRWEREQPGYIGFRPVGRWVCPRCKARVKRSDRVCPKCRWEYPSQPIETLFG